MSLLHAPVPVLPAGVAVAAASPVEVLVEEGAGRFRAALSSQHIAFSPRNIFRTKSAMVRDREKAINRRGR